MILITEAFFFSTACLFNFYLRFQTEFQKYSTKCIVLYTASQPEQSDTTEIYCTEIEKSRNRFTVQLGDTKSQ